MSPDTRALARVQRVGPVAHLRLDDPERLNSLSLALAQAATAISAMAKDLINRGQSLSLEDLLKLEEQSQAIALGAPQTLAAMRAFLDDRDDGDR